MKIVPSKRASLLAILLPCALALSITVHAETNKLMTKSGGNAQSYQHATMEKEQWDDMRNLHQGINKRTEEEQDKAGATLDNRSKCEQGANINAYWESNTLHYPDRRADCIITP